MRILIATGIFEPEAGGPATYTPKLASMMCEKGWNVTVLTYSMEEKYDFDESYPYKLIRIKRRNRILNRIRFFRAVWKLSRDVDLIYTLDWFAAGLPVAVAAKLRRRPYVIRIGGDYAWEQAYLESGELPIPLTRFYEAGIYLKGRYGLIFKILRFVFSGAAHIIFNSDVQRELYQKYYLLPGAKMSTIYNPVPKEEFKDIVRTKSSHEIVFWGRFNVMKNVTALVEAFAKANLPTTYHLTLIGDGPQLTRLFELVRDLKLAPRVLILHGMRLRIVLEHVKNCRAFVLPSWTDISPAQVYEALAIGLPALVTKENFLPIRDQLPETIDPLSIDDIAAKLRMLADDTKYAEFARQFSAISQKHDWPNVLQQHVAIFANISGKPAEGIRVLQIGSDRSKRGILYPDSPGAARQRAYGERFGALDIVGFSLRSDKRKSFDLTSSARIYPTNSPSRALFGVDALMLAMRLPRPDVVSTQDPFETGLIALIIAKLRRVPLHVQIHTDFLSPGYIRHSLTNRIRVRIAGFVLRRASRIRVVSERIKKSVVATYHTGVIITVLPIFTDIERFRNARPGDLTAMFHKFSKRVLVIARLEREKNVALAIRAFAKVAPKDACLIVVGEGSERASLQRLSRRLRVSDRTIFEDPVDVAPYVALADIVLVTSDYEGYGLVIIEALAAGKPVLSTDVGIASEVGALVETPDHYAEALAEWFQNGPTEMKLLEYPYSSFEEYVQSYCDDISATANPSSKSLHK